MVPTPLAAEVVVVVPLLGRQRTALMVQEIMEVTRRPVVVTEEMVGIRPSAEHMAMMVPPQAEEVVVVNATTQVRGMVAMVPTDVSS